MKIIIDFCFLIPKYICSLVQMLSEFIKGKIVAFDECNLSISEISRRVKFSRTCIREFLRKYNETGDYKRKVGTGKKRKTSEREDRLIIRTAKKQRTITKKKIQCEVGTSLSLASISNRLKEKGFFSRFAIKKPYVSKINQKKKI